MLSIALQIVNFISLGGNMRFSDYHSRAMKTAQYKSGTLRALSYTTLGLTGEAGEVAERIKKILREDDRDLQEVIKEKKEAIVKEMGDVLWYLAALANEIGVNLEDVADANLAKLDSRYKRGVIYGDGDNR